MIDVLFRIHVFEKKIVCNTCPLELPSRYSKCGIGWFRHFVFLELVNSLHETKLTSAQILTNS